MQRKKRERREPVRRSVTTLDRARDELFSAIRQCGVMEAPMEEQEEWMADTVKFMAGRHPELTAHELDQLLATGIRFCQPVIPHGREHTAVSLEDANAA